MDGDSRRLKGRGHQEAAKPVGDLASEAGSKHAVLIAGMHRSGTSALAGTMNLLGCAAPQTLMKSGRHNPRGFFESRAIMQFNDEILKSAGTCWDDWEPINPGWLASPVADGFKAQAQQVLAAEFGPTRLFVLKDPRICRLMPFWLDALQAFGARPLVACPIRNPLDVAASLEKRNGFDPGYGQLLWLRHVLDAEAASRGFARAFLRYEDLLTDWQSIAARLATEFDLAWPRQATATDREINEFLTSDLRHHAHGTRSVDDDPRVADWIRTSFAILRRWAQGDVREDDATELDGIRAALDAAAPAFARPLRVGRAAARDAASHEAKAAELAQKLAAEEARATALSQALEARTGELSEAAERLATEEARARKAEKARDKEAGRLAGAQRVIGELRERTRRRDAELARRKHETARLKERAETFELLYEKLRHSSSWRMTAPIREIARAWRRLVRKLRGVEPTKVAAVPATEGADPAKSRSRPSPDRRTPTEKAAVNGQEPDRP